MEDKGTPRLPDKTQEDWYQIIKQWPNTTLSSNLTGAQYKEDAGRSDNWSAAVIRVARERGFI